MDVIGADRNDFPVPSFPVIFRGNIENLTSEEEKDEDETPPPIFSKDPAEWFRVVDHRVVVTLDNGKTMDGVVFTVDPVSESVVLVNPAKDGGLAIEMVMGCVVKSVTILSKADDEFLTQMQKAFTTESNHLLTDNELEEKRNDVCDWLTANRIPVEIGGTGGDVIKVAGNALIIHPPYDCENCVSLNEIVLKKVQTLLKNRSV